MNISPLKFMAYKRNVSFGENKGFEITTKNGKTRFTGYPGNYSKGESRFSFTYPPAPKEPDNDSKEQPKPTDKTPKPTDKTPQTDE